MAPHGRQRSRRRPRAATGGLLEARKQQSYEATALRVTAARLTRPAERCFRNQRESLRASRNVEPGPMNLSGRLQRDLLNLVRGGERSRLRRSPTPSPPPRRRRSSRERHRGRSRSKRVALRSPSLLPSSSDASHASRDRRRRSRRRRSGWSSSSDEFVRVARAPGARAARAPGPSSDDRAAPPPLVRASLQHGVSREFVTPANTAVPTRGGGADVPSGGSFGRPETPKEKRERQIVFHCVAELHRSLNKKCRRLQPTSNGVLSKVRSFLLDVAREARSNQEPETDTMWYTEEEEEEEEEKEEDISDPGVIPDQEFIPEEQEIPDPAFIPEPEEIPDPEFIPESEEIPDPKFVPEPEEMPDPEFIPEPQEIPDPEFIPELDEIPDPDFIPEPLEIPDPEFLPSPEPMADEEPAVELFMEDSSELPVATLSSSLLPDSPTRAGAKSRKEQEEEKERREPGADLELWRPRAVSSTSSFLMTWGDGPASGDAWRPPLPPPPPPAIMDATVGSGRWGDRGLFPPCLLPVRTAGHGHFRSWGEEAGQQALHRPSSWFWSSEARSTSWPDWRRPAPPQRPPMLGAPPPPLPPPRSHTREALPWMRTCEELLPNPEPAEWRGARRCFSPSADHPPMNLMNRQRHFNRRHIPEQHRQRFPRPMHSDDAARQRNEMARHDGVADSWRYSLRKMF